MAKKKMFAKGLYLKFKYKGGEFYGSTKGLFKQLGIGGEFKDCYGIE